MEMWDHETIGQRISRLLMEQNLTDDDLVDRTGLTIQAIVGLMNGRIKALGEYRERLSKALGVTEHYLLNGEPYAERETMARVKAMRKSGLITADDERRIRPLVSEAIKTRSNAKVPLNDREIESIIDVMRG